MPPSVQRRPPAARPSHTGIAWLVGVALAASAVAEPIVFTDEAEFLAALDARGDCVVEEGFEDDLAWGGVRSTIPGGNHSAPSVSRRGVTWEPNNAPGGVSTSSGAAVTGDWGFYELPRGDYRFESEERAAADEEMADEELVSVAGGVTQSQLDGALACCWGIDSSKHCSTWSACRTGRETCHSEHFVGFYPMGDAPG